MKRRSVQVATGAVCVVLRGAHKVAGAALALAAVSCGGYPEEPAAIPRAPLNCPELPVAAQPPRDVISPDSGEGPQGRFRVGPEHFAVWDGERYRELFVRAMNLGVSLPGDGPNDLSGTYEEYRCWLGLLGPLGVNAVRLYVPHFPAFYRALADHNRATPEYTIYLLQGAYLPEHREGTDELDLQQHAAQFDAMLNTLVDIVHGRADVPKAVRGAYGTYDVDVSAWTLGWLVGREVLGQEALATNAAHPHDTTYEGKRLRMLNATPTEVFMAARLDQLVDRELSVYGSSRPFAWSNWLELDPLQHPTEPSTSKSDRASADFAKLDAFGAPAGHFVSYHAYPYYPNFVNDDPDYRNVKDAEGPNSYLGLIEDLRRHHRGQALFIGEFGVPSSWGRAHTSFSGMHHGGLSEDQQGHYGARLARNIASIGAAGFAYFQWTDGWWKRIWITSQQTFPHERLRYWHDLMNAQQHYGLLAFELPLPDWSTAAVVRSDASIRELRVHYDAEFVHLRVQLRAALEGKQQLLIGLDTYADERGESLLPNGVRTKRKNEFMLRVSAAGEAELEVMRSYDLRYINAAKPPPGAMFRSTASSFGDWSRILWLLAGKRRSDDGRYSFPDDLYPSGVLRVRDAAAPSTLDVVFIDGEYITVKLPWTLLNFAEPPRRMVIDDDVNTPERELAQTSGIAYSLALDDALVETGRIGWTMWKTPPATRQRFKAGAASFFEALAELPTWLDGGESD